MSGDDDKEAPEVVNFWFYQSVLSFISKCWIETIPDIFYIMIYHWVKVLSLWSSNLVFDHCLILVKIAAIQTIDSGKI